MGNKNSKMPPVPSPDKFDSPWKDALNKFFREFLQLFLPQVHDGIDWTVPPEPKDKDFEKITANAVVGRQMADKLFQVRLNSGATPWVLIHIEAQGSRETEFSKRMFRYGAAIHARYDKEVIGIAILADRSKTWHPQSFGFENFGARLQYDFLTVKLANLDHAELETSENLFAPIVLAHLKTQETKGDPESRLIWKTRIVRNLYDRNFSREQIRKLFRIVDWLLGLPENLDEIFWDELSRFEGERKMPYVTSVERIGIAKGRAIGLAEGKAEAVLLVLENRFGALGARLKKKILALQDEAFLTDLIAMALVAESTKDFEGKLKAKLG